MLMMNRTLVQVVCIFSENYISNGRRSQNNIKLMLFLLFLLTLLPSKSHQPKKGGPKQQQQISNKYDDSTANVFNNVTPYREHRLRKSDKEREGERARERTQGYYKRHSFLHFFHNKRERFVVCRQLVFARICRKAQKLFQVCKCYSFLACIKRVRIKGVWLWICECVGECVCQLECAFKNFVWMCFCCWTKIYCVFLYVYFSSLSCYFLPTFTGWESVVSVGFLTPFKSQPAFLCPRKKFLMPSKHIIGKSKRSRRGGGWILRRINDVFFRILHTENK